MWSIFGSRDKDPRHLFGRRAEEEAVRFLRRKGHRILKRNHAFAGGEIDIISRDGEVLVFTEVRARADGTDPEATVDRTKQAHIRRTAEHYLLHYGQDTPVCRFDVVAIRVDDKGKRSLIHYEDAFR